MSMARSSAASRALGATRRAVPRLAVILALDPIHPAGAGRPAPLLSSPSETSFFGPAW
jgi:hypothetical protein